MSPAPEFDDSFEGVCSVCGAHGTYVQDTRSLREGYRCASCGASNRYRGQADALIRLYGKGCRSLAELATSEEFLKLRIYEPGIQSPLRRFCENAARYEKSFYWADEDRGAVRDGVRCENLEALTFPDASFDLLISSDIFEHVRHPWVAFQEMHRVLAPGGVHVFSIPAQEPMRATTHYRVDTSGDDDVMLDEPVFHGNGAGGKSLVYVDYGLDLIDHLAEIGFELELLRPDYGTQTSRKLITFIAHKR